ncbi:TPA: hypothetical protein ACRZZI_000917 [Vibrio harveyi]
MNIEERILAAKQKIEASKSKKKDAVVMITYDKVFPSIDTIEELSTKKNKKTTLHVRATVNSGKSKSIIKIPLHELTTVPVSKKEVLEKYATEHFLSEHMHLKTDYFEKMKPLCELAVLHNQLAAQKFDERREKFEHKDGSMIYNSAKPIHELCEWIGKIESDDMHGVELNENEAEDIQQAMSRLESILSNMGYENKSFNVEKYQNDEIAEIVDNKYNIRRAHADPDKTKEEKQIELERRRVKRFTLCKEEELEPLPQSATTNTVSPSRQAYEEACRRPVKEGRSNSRMGS